MKVLPFILLTALSSLPMVALGQATDDEKAIHAIVKQMEDGWNEGSGAKFAAPFAVNADYVVVNGMKIKTRNVIDKGHEGIFKGIYKGSHNIGKVESVRFLRPDVAITHVLWELKYTENGQEKTNKARATMTLAKNDGKWEIESFQNTSIQGQ